MISRLRNFYRELRRRSVVRVGIVYLAVGFAILEGVDLLVQPLLLPDWTTTLVVVLLIVGFPVALVCAWAFDLTPEGVKRTPPEPTSGTAAAVPVSASGSGEPSAPVAGPPAGREPAPGAAGPPERKPAERSRGPFEPGREVSHYRLEERLGSGGMGIVFRAVDLRLDRPVALKFLAPVLSDVHEVERFRNEAQAAAALEHPNVCTILEIGEADDGRLFIAMPFYAGETVERKLARGPLPPDEALGIALQVAGGLGRAHERGIVHRDIKPANLMVLDDGLVKILDFGLAKAADVTLTRPGAAVGTVAYMSPEQVRGDEVDSRADIWGLGAVLYEMLGGVRPFPGETEASLLNAILNREPVPLPSLRPEVPRPLDEAARRLMSKDPQGRPADMGAAGALLREARERAAASRGDRTPVPPARARLSREGERRQLTVVVSRIGGFGELVERLDPEELDELLEGAEAAAREVAERHGGTVNRSDGEELVLLFGLPTAHEDDFARGCRAALEIERRVGTLIAGTTTGGGPSADARVVGLQSGIETGSVVAREGDGSGPRYRITGTAARTAATLASHAAAGEVLVGPGARRLLLPFFRLEPADRALSLPDRDAPAAPYRIAGAREAGGWMAAGERWGLTPLVGREEEIMTLHDALRRARSGQGRFVTVTGEAGTGKSRLLYEFRHQLDAGEVVVVQGRCRSFGGGASYLPFVHALQDYLELGAPAATASSEAVDRILDLAPELEEFVPLYLKLLGLAREDRPVPGNLEGAQFRVAAREALAALFTLGAHRRPTVMLLEDWHWSDEASQEVLKQLVEMASSYPLLLVVTARPEDDLEWPEQGDRTPLALGNFDAAASAAIVAGAVGAERVPGSLARLLHERAGGNPFFLEELCRTLVEEGALRVEDGEVVHATPLDDLDLPGTVEAVIRSRLDRLEPGVREIVLVASVVGREFSRPVLERALEEHGAEPGKVGAALERARKLGLIQQYRVLPDPAYRFKHALTREVAYDTLLARQRTALHGAVGRAIESVYDGRLEEHLDALARHFSRAEAWEEAAEYGLGAAKRAAELGEAAEALAQLDRTVEWLAHLPDEARWAELRVEIFFLQERMCETLGLRDRQEALIGRLLERLVGEGDTVELARARLRKGDLCIFLRQYGEAEEALRAALETSRRIGDRVMERNTLRSFGMLRYHQERYDESAVESLERAVAIDRERGDMEGLVGDLHDLAQTLRRRSELDRARTCLEEAIEICEAHDVDRSRLSYCLSHLAAIALALGDRDAAVRHGKRGIELVDSGRLPVLREQKPIHRGILAGIYMRMGRVDEAVKLYRSAVDAAREANRPDVLANTLRSWGTVLLGLDRPAEALPHLEEAAELFAGLRDRRSELAVRAKMARAAEESGRWPLALEIWSEVRAGWSETGEERDRSGELDAAEGVARALRRTGDDPERVRVSYREAARAARAAGALNRELHLRNTVAVLCWRQGDRKGALAAYERALELAEEGERESERGLVLNGLGAVLHELGERERARDLLEEAAELNRALGSRGAEADSLAALGKLHYDESGLAEAARCYERSLHLRREEGDEAGAGWMLYHLARIAHDREDERAPSLLSDAWRAADRTGDGELMKICEALGRKLERYPSEAGPD